jgi:HlyD family secretion protein
VSRTLGWVLLALVALGGSVFWYVTRETPVAVTLATVDRGRVEATVANTRAGTVEACQRAQLAPALGGQIARLPVREGERVKAGDVLLELWNDDLAAERLLAERETASARARVDEACSMADVASGDANRLLRLRRQGVASVEATERAVGESIAHRAACEAARVAVGVAEARVDVTSATLERSRLRAPFDGVVAEINGEVGEFVTPSPVGIPMPPTVDLIDTSCLYVKAPIDEVDAAGVAPHMAARITLDAFPGRTFAGRVRRIAPYVLDLEKQARTVEIEAVFSDPAEMAELLPGYSADVEIVLSARDDVLRVPTEAVLDGRRVLVYGERNGRLESHTIVPGLDNWQFTEVREGVEQGARVVTSVGRAGVVAGARAEPEPAGAAGEPTR